MKIEIENPIGNCTHTGRNRALRLVRAGRAVLVSEFRIRLTEKASKTNEAIAEENAKRRQREASERHYDHIHRLIMPEAAKRTPFVGDIYALYHGKSMVGD